MPVVDIHKAKTHLSRLVDRASAGEMIIIARAGRPVVRVVRYDEPAEGGHRRLGVLEDVLVPDDFDRMGDERIARDFEGRR